MDGAGSVNVVHKQVAVATERPERMMAHLADDLRTTATRMNMENWMVLKAKNKGRHCQSANQNAPVDVAQRLRQ